MTDKLQEAEIKLSDGQKWVIVHNMPQDFGMNVECALDNYLARADKPTAKGFSEYIKSKGFKAWPRMQEDKIK
jgi:hypothetical protein